MTALSRAGLLAALIAAASARPGADRSARRGGDASRHRTIRSDRLLDGGGDGGLALAHGNATEGRLCQRAAQREGRALADTWDPNRPAQGCKVSVRPA